MASGSWSDPPSGLIFDMEPGTLQPAMERHPLRSLRPSLGVAGILTLVITLAAELFLSVRAQSQTWNEALHLFAGYRYWQCRDFGINPEHPPLMKWLASAPLLPLRLSVPQLPQGTSKQESNVAGRKFLYAHDADALLFRARLAAGIVTVLFALLLFEATCCILGRGPAFLALVLFVFEPNILAHGALVTTDVGMSCFLFAAVYSYYRFAKQPSTLTLVECGLMAGLALSAKHSGIFIFPILGLLAGFEILSGPRFDSAEGPQPARRLDPLKRRFLRLGAQYVIIAAIALATLWAFYAFRFEARPDGGKMTPPLAVYVRSVKSPVYSRAILALESWHVLPQSYLYGLADVLIVSAGPRPAFLLGKLYPHGRWFYFPAAFVIKSTLGFLGLLLLAPVARGWLDRHRRREVLFVAVPPALYFAVSLTSGLDIGIRHILPVYPFLIVIAAAAAWGVMERSPRLKYVVIVLMGLHVVSSLRSFPDYLAYSNEAWGGPTKTYLVLTDSNVDWGQGLKSAKLYLDRHHIKDCWLGFFGSADPGYYEIPCKHLPDAFDRWWGRPVEVVPEDYQGTVLLSATQAAGVYWGPGELNPYGEFLKSFPAEVIGGSILVFRGRINLKGASQRSRLDRAWQLLAESKLDLALGEARGVASAAPRMVYAHYTLGHLLAQANRKDEARREYETCLTLAQTVHAEFQWFWIPFIQSELKQL